MSLLVGLFVGREWSFPPAFLDAVRARGAGVAAEIAKIGGTRMNEPCPYRVIVDRISHEVPYYRSYLKNAVLQGTCVLNNPFRATVDDRFVQGTLAARLGLSHPKTVVLPNRDYGPRIVHQESLRNLIYPLDWIGIAEHVGLPCVLKDAHSRGGRAVSICHSVPELIHCYNQSGQATMMVQERVDWQQFVRCLCIGPDEVLVMGYDPRERRTFPAELDASLLEQIRTDSLKVMRAMGYDVNLLEWGIRDGSAVAIDLLHPTPDLEINTLTQPFFEWAVTHLADLVIRRAHEPVVPAVAPWLAEPHSSGSSGAE